MSGSVGNQLEAYFIRHMLAEVKTESSGLFGEGIAGSTFKSMLDEALAEKMTEAGGVGLAQTFDQSMSPQSITPPDLSTRQAHKKYASAASLSNVVNGTVSSNFGMRHDPITGHMKEHHGIDIASPAGTRVHAAGPGRVVRAENAGAYGNLVVIDHGDGVETRYAHLEKIEVRPGDEIVSGQIIGAVGATGRATGAHLHFEVRRDGNAVDPHSAQGLINPPSALRDAVEPE